jgi:hypothetical protein
VHPTENQHSVPPYMIAVAPLINRSLYSRSGPSSSSERRDAVTDSRADPSACKGESAHTS